MGSGILAMVLAESAYQEFKGALKAATAGVGLALGILVASFASNGLINPAVAVGVQSWSFVYAAAPILGALVGMNLYVFLFTDRPKRAKVAKTVVSKPAANKVVTKKKPAKKK